MRILQGAYELANRVGRVTYPTIRASSRGREGQKGLEARITKYMTTGDTMGITLRAEVFEADAAFLEDKHLMDLISQIQSSPEAVLL